MATSSRQPIVSDVDNAPDKSVGPGKPKAEISGVQVEEMLDRSAHSALSSSMSHALMSLPTLLTPTACESGELDRPLSRQRSSSVGCVSLLSDEDEDQLQSLGKSLSVQRGPRQERLSDSNASPVKKKKHSPRDRQPSLPALRRHFSEPSQKTTDVKTPEDQRAPDIYDGISPFLVALTRRRAATQGGADQGKQRQCDPRASSSANRELLPSASAKKFSFSGASGRKSQISVPPRSTSHGSLYNAPGAPGPIRSSSFILPQTTRASTPAVPAFRTPSLIPLGQPGRTTSRTKSLLFSNTEVARRSDESTLSPSSSTASSTPRKRPSLVYSVPSSRFHPLHRSASAASALSELVNQSTRFSASDFVPSSVPLGPAVAQLASEVNHSPTSPLALPASVVARFSSDGSPPRVLRSRSSLTGQQLLEHFNQQRRLSQTLTAPILSSATVIASPVRALRIDLDSLKTTPAGVPISQPSPIELHDDDEDFNDGDEFDAFDDSSAPTPNSRVPAHRRTQSGTEPTPKPIVTEARPPGFGTRLTRSESAKVLSYGNGSGEGSGTQLTVSLTSSNNSNASSHGSTGAPTTPLTSRSRGTRVSRGSLMELSLNKKQLSDSREKDSRERASMLADSENSASSIGSGGSREAQSAGGSRVHLSPPSGSEPRRLNDVDTIGRTAGLPPRPRLSLTSSGGSTGHAKHSVVMQAADSVSHSQASTTASAMPFTPLGTPREDTRTPPPEKLVSLLRRVSFSRKSGATSPNQTALIKDLLLSSNKEDVKRGERMLAHMARVQERQIHRESLQRHSFLRRSHNKSDTSDGLSWDDVRARLVEVEGSVAPSGRRGSLSGAAPMEDLPTPKRRDSWSNSAEVGDGREGLILPTTPTSGRGVRAGFFPSSPRPSSASPPSSLLTALPSFSSNSGALAPSSPSFRPNRSPFFAGLQPSGTPPVSIPPLPASPPLLVSSLSQRSLGSPVIAPTATKRGSAVGAARNSVTRVSAVGLPVLPEEIKARMSETVQSQRRASTVSAAPAAVLSVLDSLRPKKRGSVINDSSPSTSASAVDPATILPSPLPTSLTPESSAFRRDSQMRRPQRLSTSLSTLDDIVPASPFDVGRTSVTTVDSENDPIDDGYRFAPTTTVFLQSRGHHRRIEGGSLRSAVPVTSQDPLIPTSLNMPVKKRDALRNLERYKPLKVLGSGANGVVLMVERVRDRKRFAAKIVPVSRPSKNVVTHEQSPSANSTPTTTPGGTIVDDPSELHRNSTASASSDGSPPAANTRLAVTAASLGFKAHTVSASEFKMYQHQLANGSNTNSGNFHNTTGISMSGVGGGAVSGHAHSLSHPLISMSAVLTTTPQPPTLGDAAPTSFPSKSSVAGTISVPISSAPSMPSPSPSSASTPASVPAPALASSCATVAPPLSPRFSSALSQVSTTSTMGSPRTVVSSHLSDTRSTHTLSPLTPLTPLSPRHTPPSISRVSSTTTTASSLSSGLASAVSSMASSPQPVSASSSSGSAQVRGAPLLGPHPLTSWLRGEYGISASSAAITPSSLPTASLSSPSSSASSSASSSSSSVVGARSPLSRKAGPSLPLPPLPTSPSAAAAAAAGLGLVHNLSLDSGAMREHKHGLSHGLPGRTQAATLPGHFTGSSAPPPPHPPPSSASLPAPLHPEFLKKRQSSGTAPVPVNRVYTVAAYSEILISKLVSDLPAHFVRFEEVFKVHTIEPWVNQFQGEEQQAVMKTQWKTQAKRYKFNDYEVVIMDLCAMTFEQYLLQFRTRSFPTLFQQLMNRGGIHPSPAHALPKPVLGQLRFVSFAIAFSLLTAKMLIGLEWNDLANRNILLQEIPPHQLRSVYRYRVCDDTDGFQCEWFVPQEDLPQHNGKLYTVKFVDLGVSEAHGGTAYQRTLGFQYRKMVDKGVMKRAGGLEDKDIVDLEGTILATLQHTHLKAVPANLFSAGYKTHAAFMHSIAKGGAAIARLKEVLATHKFYAPYRRLASSKKFRTPAGLQPPAYDFDVDAQFQSFQTQPFPSFPYLAPS